MSEMILSRPVAPSSLLKISTSSDPYHNSSATAIDIRMYKSLRITFFFFYFF